jgi:hypothetical protein
LWSTVEIVCTTPGGSTGEDDPPRLLGDIIERASGS